MSNEELPTVLFVDSLVRILPRWLQARIDEGKTVAFRFVRVMIMLLDAGVEVLVQATLARYPGLGTHTALNLIGQSRGLIRAAFNETNATFAAYLRQWLDLRKHAGQQLYLAKAIGRYLGGVKVKVINRAGTMVTLEADNTTSSVEYGVAWDWDSLSNPEKEAHWSEQWVIVYTPPWDVWGPTLPELGDGSELGDIVLGLGHQVPREHVDAMFGLFDDWKAARTRINTVIFTYDASLFDPEDPDTMPDGWFGKWGRPDPDMPGRRIPSRFEDARYWAPNPIYFGGPQGDG